MRSILTAVALCATLFIVGCSTADDPVAANASSGKSSSVTRANTQKIPVKVTILNKCTGEKIPFEGEITIVTQRNDNGDGTLIHTKFDIHATGVGSLSGIEYILNETRTDIYKINDDRTRSPRTQIIHTRIISKGNNPNRDVYIHYHIVLDQDGEPVVVIDEFDIDC